MAAAVLTEAQRLKLVEWLVAGFPYPLIRQLFLAQGWKPITPQAVDYHRTQHQEEIIRRVQERLDAAYDAGLAQREARVRALNDHAAKLEELKWLADEKGKLWNEKAWRETLDDLAKEMGHRAINANVNATVETIKRVGNDLEEL